MTATVEGEPTRVCVLTSVHNPFDQRVFYKEAVSLVEAGFDVTVIGPAPAHVEGDHHGVHLLPTPPSTSRVRRLLSHRHLLRMAGKTRADVYHLHDPELLLLGCILRAAGHCVVYDVHENFPAVVLSRAWVPDRLRRPLSRLVEIVERKMARRLNGVVGVVDEQQGRFRHRPFVTVSNYPRLEWFQPRAQADAGASPCPQQAELIHVGSLSRERGAHFLLEIMRELGHTHPHVRLNALGPFHTRADEVAFAATVREYGLQDTVCWRTGRLPYDELGDFVARHRIGLIPGQVSAKNLTPFVPTKLFEYLACGLPVVASALPSIVGFSHLGQWGILADPSDPAAHAAAVVRLLEDPCEAERLGAGGRGLVESMCNWEAESAKLVGLYGKVLGSAGRARSNELTQETHS